MWTIGNYSRLKSQYWKLISTIYIKSICIFEVTLSAFLIILFSASELSFQKYLKELNYFRLNICKTQHCLWKFLLRVSIWNKILSELICLEYNSI